MIETLESLRRALQRGLLDAASHASDGLLEIAEAAKAATGSRAAVILLAAPTRHVVTLAQEPDSEEIDWPASPMTDQDGLGPHRYLEAEIVVAGAGVATLAVADNAPRSWTMRDRLALQRLANLAAIIETSLAKQSAIASEAPGLEMLLGVAAMDRRVLEALSDGLILQDDTGRILDCNPSAGRILGLSPLELIGLTTQDPSWRITTEAGEQLRGGDHPSMVALRTGRPVDDFVIHVQTPSGNGRWVTVSSQPLFANGSTTVASHVVTTFVDVSAVKLKERRLSEQRVHELLEALPAAIYTVDPQGFVTYSNATAEAFWDPEPRGGRRRWCGSSKLYGPDGAAVAPGRSAMARCLEGQRAIRGEQGVSERADGRRTAFQSYPTPLFDPDGTLTGGVNMLIDISEIKAAEARQAALIGQLETAKIDIGEALRLAEAGSLAKSRFLANMSHELRTPLNGIVGIVDAISRTPLEARQVDMLRLVSDSAHALEAILSDILDTAKIEAEKLELDATPFDLRDLVRSVGEMTRDRCDQKGLKFDIEITPEAAGVYRGDGGRVRQILSNLLSNAIKFTDQGSITLRLSAQPSVDDLGRREVTIAVSDTGLGFGDETAARLCERFEQADTSITRRFGGTGLGLPIARDLALLMDGDLTWSSEIGIGSRFVVVLRLAVERATALIAGDGIDIQPSQTGLRILIAEDHPVNRKVLEIMLQPCDCTLTFVENGLEAVEATAREAFDVVLMDMQMPIMDGLTAIREIRARELKQNKAQMAIAMLSANVGPEHQAAALLAGADCHIGKPATLQGIFEGVERALAAHAG